MLCLLKISHSLFIWLCEFTWSKGEAMEMIGNRYDFPVPSPSVFGSSDDESS